MEYDVSNYGTKEMLQANNGHETLWRGWQTPAPPKLTFQYQPIRGSNEVLVPYSSMPPKISNYSSIKVQEEPFITKTSQINRLHLSGGRIKVHETQQVIPKDMSLLKEMLKKSVRKWKVDNFGAGNVPESIRSPGTIAEIVRDSALNANPYIVEPAPNTGSKEFIINSINEYTKPCYATPNSANFYYKEEKLPMNVRLFAKEVQKESCVVPIREEITQLPAYPLKTMDWTSYPETTKMSCSNSNVERVNEEQSTNQEFIAQDLILLKEMIKKSVHKWKVENFKDGKAPKSLSSLATIAEIVRGTVDSYRNTIKVGSSTSSRDLPVKSRIAEYIPAPIKATPTGIATKHESHESIVASCFELVPIGDGNAYVPAYFLNTMDWRSYAGATRSLLEAVFGRETLGTHNLSGKASPAFLDKAPKRKLNAAKVNDIIITVIENCGVTAEMVRTCITTKCSYESSLLKEKEKRAIIIIDDD